MFIQKYLELLATYPVTTVSFSVCLLAIIIHTIVPSWYGVRNMLLSYWSRGKAETDNPYVRFLVQGVKASLTDTFMEGNTEYSLSKDGSMYYWRAVNCGKMGFNRNKTYSSGHSDCTNAFTKYDTQDEALKDMQSFMDEVHKPDTAEVLFMNWLLLGFGTIAIMIGSLIIDYMLVNHFTLLCILGLTALVFLIVTKGGRYVYDINAKVEKIDALTKEKGNATD